MTKIRLNLAKLPMSVKIKIAKILRRCLKDLTNDIVLYNELNLWIETKGRPQTSNANHWINTK